MCSTLQRATTHDGVKDSLRRHPCSRAKAAGQNVDRIVGWVTPKIPLGGYWSCAKQRA